MGCGGPLKDIVRAEPDMKHWRSSFRSVGVEDNDLLQLYDLYSHAREQQVIGKLEVLTVFKMLDIERQKFMFKVFAAFRRDKNEEKFSDFRDFAFSLWNFCTMTSVHIANFAFDLYDSKRAGKVEIEALCSMVKDIYGYEYRNSEIAKAATTNLQNSKKTKVDRETYISVVEKTPRLFQKLLKIQSTVRRKSIDLEFWQHLSDTRYGIAESKQLKAFSELNPEFCACKIDASISKSRYVVSARIADKSNEQDAEMDEHERSKADTLAMRLFKRPNSESRMAKRKAVQSSRANAVQRALALDQIRKEQKQALNAAKKARAELQAASANGGGGAKSNTAAQEAKPEPQAPPVTVTPSVVYRHNSLFEPMQTHIEGRHESDQSYSEDRPIMDDRPASQSRPSGSTQSRHADQSRRWSAPVSHLNDIQINEGHRSTIAEYMTPLAPTNNLELTEITDNGSRMEYKTDSYENHSA